MNFSLRLVYFLTLLCAPHCLPVGSFNRLFRSDSYQKKLDTDLFEAVSYRDASQMKELLEKGANPNARDANLNTPLMESLYRNFLPTIELLLKADADVNAQNLYGQSALHFATIYSDSAILNKLIKAGAHPFLKNHEEETPLEFGIHTVRSNPTFKVRKVATLASLIKFIASQFFKTSHTAVDAEKLFYLINSFREEFKDSLSSADTVALSSLLGKLSNRYKLLTSYLDKPNQIPLKRLQDLLRIYDVSVVDTQQLENSADALPAISPGAVGLTQTESYLSLPELKKNVILEYSNELKRYPKLIRRIIEQEKKFKDYDVFYHGQKRDLILFHDVIREIQNWLAKQNVADFEYVRLPENQKIKLSEFLKKEAVSDLMTPGASELLSVNFSLFGNTGRFDESSFSYFMLNKSINPPTKILDTIFTTLGLNKRYIPDILDLLKYLESPTGSLLQIFIPRDKVKEYTYLSKPLGEPLTGNYISLGHPLGLIEVTQVDGTTATYDLAKLDTRTYLDLYRNHPEAINSLHLNTIQGRIAITRDFMLNPASGVKIFRYTTVHPEKFLEYQQKLDRIVTDMMQDWKQRNITPVKEHGVTEKLLCYFSDVISYFIKQ